MRKIVVGAGCWLALLIATPALAGGPKLGVVNVQKVMEAIPAWKKAMESLKKDFEAKKTSLDARQAGLQKQKEQLEAKRMVSDPKAIAEEEQKFAQSANEFRTEFMTAQQDISMRETKLKESVLARIEQVVAVVAQEGDYDYVFETGPEEQPNVIYSAKQSDLSQKVVEAYKKAFGDKPIVAQNGPQPAQGTPKK